MQQLNMAEGISVIMPVYNQASFIKRAIESLKLQSHQVWELIVINDGSSDNLAEVLSPYFTDVRIKYIENPCNEGLGACLNKGIESARFSLIAYLPADDLFYKDHLESLSSKLIQEPDSILAYSGVRHHYNRSALGQIDGYPLQLVQVLHRKNSERWTERQELVTDDLGRMYWNKLSRFGKFVETGIITCQWVDHPSQRHKIIQEPIGGINPYKLYYNVNQPLKYHSTVGNFIDEVSYFKPFRDIIHHPIPQKRLKIVLVGELAYNSERVVALEEQGHKLYGLWMKDPYWYNAVGPLPFGNIEDIPYDSWQQSLEEIQPDVIYALLNWQAVPFAHEVLTNNPGVPFVWHFKEGPFICLEKGMWNLLSDLYTKSDGQIYSSPEMMEWFRQFIPVNPGSSLVLDGDLPKQEWFTEEVSPLLSDSDGEIHTVVPGRPIGLHPHNVTELAENKIHLHFYGDFTHGQWREWIIKTEKLAPGYFHIHANCTQDNWVKEFSKYDAGWLHFFQSENNGEMMRANWDDLNYPARISTLAAAGLPMLQRDNSGHLVATQNLARQHNLGLFFTTVPQLREQLSDKQRMSAIRQNIWQKREMFTFDYHVKDLVSFFRKVIAAKQLLATEKDVA